MNFSEFVVPKCFQISKPIFLTLPHQMYTTNQHETPKGYDPSFPYLLMTDLSCTPKFSVPANLCGSKALLLGKLLARPSSRSTTLIIVTRNFRVRGIHGTASTTPAHNQKMEQWQLLHRHGVMITMSRSDVHRLYILRRIKTCDTLQ